MERSLSISMEFIGIAAGALTTLGFIPQIIRVYKLKSAREISITFNNTLLVGITLWLTYGIVHGLAPLIIWIIIGIILISSLLAGKLKYGR
ncbi:SemiSWEET family sugar transporter [Chloroflexota bacterium]